MNDGRNISSNRLRVKIKGGKVDGVSREILKENIERMQDGWYDLGLKKVNAEYENPSRYKYYFDGLLPSIFDAFSTRYRIMTQDGKIRACKDTTELHDNIRAEFCKVQVIQPNGAVIVMPVSTTELSDTEFITDYLGRIMAVAVNEYAVEFMDYDTWRGVHELKRLTKEAKYIIVQAIKDSLTDKEIKAKINALPDQKITAYGLDYARQKMAE